MSLSRLHQQLSQSIAENSYMGLDSSAQLIKKTTKEIQFHQVFTKATEEIEASLRTTPASTEEFNDRLSHLRLIQADGTQYYDRYCRKTNTWSRWILKTIARFTPTFFKRFLPRCFSNQMSWAELQTKVYYHQFNRSIDGAIAQLTRENEAREAQRISQENAGRDRCLQNYYGLLADFVKMLNQSEEMPIPEESFFGILRVINMSLKHIIQTEQAPNIKETICQRTGLDGTIYDVLSPFNFEEEGDPSLRLKTAIQPTIWGPALMEACEPKETIFFAMRKLKGLEKQLFLRDERNIVLRNEDLSFFRGKLIIRPFTFELLEELKIYLEENPECKPSFIQIIRNENSPPLNGELIDLLYDLYESHQSIEFPFTPVGPELDLTIEQEVKLIKLLTHTANAPVPVELTERPKPSLLPHHYATLLMVQPSFLNQCCRLMNIEEIPFMNDEGGIFKRIHEAKQLDLADFPHEQLPLLLKKLKNLEEVNLSGQPVTDLQIKEWIRLGYFNHLKSITLDNCPRLTTDVLFSLSSLTQLERLSLTELPAGQQSLHELPPSDDPFKIKLFYSHLTSTSALATAAYRGPWTTAYLFQIAMIRNGLAVTFPPQQNILNPHSVACWLLQNDYENLTEQVSIRTIDATNRAELTDENIVPFCSKFPNATKINLSQCHGIHDSSLERLLEALPNVQEIDITGCQNITADFIAAHQGKLISDPQECLTITQEMLDGESVVDYLTAMTEPLNIIKSIDLSGCPDLTNEELSDLLNLQARGAADARNPRRLNISRLNLKGCSKITTDAFTEDKRLEANNEVVFLKPLGNLRHILDGGTQIQSNLHTVYEHILFQDEYRPLMQKIDLMKTIAIEPDQRNIEDRIVCELFDC